MALNELLGDSYREGMSEEEISQAFEKVLAKRDAETAKLKNAFNKASSDVAKYKQDLKDHMSDEEKKANEQKELLEKLQKENEEFKKQSVITDNKAKFIGLGYSEDLAQQTAEALFNGDLTTFFTNQKAVWDAKEKEIRAGVMKDTPVPPAGSAGKSGVTLAQLRSMSVKDRYEFSQKNPEEYERLYEGKE